MMIPIEIKLETVLAKYGNIVKDRKGCIEIAYVRLRRDTHIFLIWIARICEPSIDYTAVVMTDEV